MRLILVLRRRLKHRMQIRRKRMWTRKLFVDRRAKGEYQILVKDLMLFDHLYFFKSFRMSAVRFEQLLSWVAPFITKSRVDRHCKDCSIYWFSLSSISSVVSYSSTLKLSVEWATVTFSVIDPYQMVLLLLSQQSN